MHQILAEYSASITELKKNPTLLLNEANGTPIAVLNHNKPTAYLVPSETYEALMEKLDDITLAQIVQERQSERSDAVEVTLDEL